MTDEMQPQPSATLGLTATEAAKLIGISEAKFRELKSKGTFRGLESPVPGRTLYSRDKLVQWMAGRTFTPPRRRRPAA